MVSQARAVGHVIAVSGAKIGGILHRDPPATPLQAVAAPIQVGAMLKIPTPSSLVLGVVCGMQTSDPMPEAQDSQKKLVDIELLGEAVPDRNGGGDFVFRRGVTIYPALGEAILTTTPAELAQIYARPAHSNVRIGNLFQDEDLPAYVLTDDLLGKHFAILGTTGAGKSYAVTLILRSILAKHHHGHIVLLDPHNEYAQAFSNIAELLNPDTLQLPYWLLNFEEICGVIVDMGRADSEAQAEILGRSILAAKRTFAGPNDDTAYISVDTPVPYYLGDLVKNIDAAMGKLNKPENSLPYLRLKTRIEHLRADKRFAFMFSGLQVRDNLPEIFSRILRIPVMGKPITILDLSGVPSEIVDTVVSVMCRIIFDFCLWAEPAKTVPVLLVCEEAHRYVPSETNSAFGPTRKMIGRIAKEGRKYGVSLCLVSQRPSELSTTILSQCNTLFALRMSNERDQEFVQRALPESARGFLSTLPSLHTQEAIAVGEGVTVPMRLRFDDLAPEHRPRSASASFSTAWQADMLPQAAVTETIERWRRQIRGVPSQQVSDGAPAEPVFPLPPR